MNFIGVPILDWVLLLVLLGFGVEAYITTRPNVSGSSKSARRLERDDVSQAPQAPQAPKRDDAAG